ncbi:MAG: flagellar hook-associated protein FlgK [Paracoccaceae bacterium]
MASLMDIGRSAVTAQREALNVTGQNIANIETEGYRRRDASLTEVIGNQSELTAKTSQTGLGVQLSDVQRAFNSYLTDSSRSATSRFEAADTFETKIVQLENLLLPREGDLGTMMNAFFGEMSGIAALPGDMAPRAAGLAQGATMAASFNNTANVLKDLADAAFGEMQSKVEEVNLLTAALGTVNGRLRSSNLGGTPPNMLLDERDRLIDEISERMNVTVAVGERYEAEVFIGSSEMGPNLVSGERVTPLAALLTSEKAVKFKLGTNTFISSIHGGAINGLNDAFSATQAAVSDLDALARKIATDMNKQHQQGIDLEGELGNAMFTTADFEINVGVNNRGDTSVTLNKIPGQVDAYDYIEFTYSGASSVWTGRDGDGVILGSGRTQLQLEGGMIEFSGKPKDGDTFQMSRVSGDASRMSFLLTRAEQFAAASTLKVTINAGNEGTGNLSTSIASIPSSGLSSIETVLKNHLSPVAATDFIRDGVVAVIPANVSAIEFASLNNQPTMRVATADVSTLQNVAFQLDGTSYSFDVDATKAGETVWQHGAEIANSLNNGVVRAAVNLGSSTSTVTAGTGSVSGILTPIGTSSTSLTTTIEGVSITAATTAGSSLQARASALTNAINNSTALSDKGISAAVSADINVQVVGSKGVSLSSLGVFAAGFEGGIVLASGSSDADGNAKAFSNATFRLSGSGAQAAETNPAQVASDIQIFTREGRQIAGNPLTDGQAATLLTPLNGFVSGAEYRADYLTSEDGVGYRGMSVDTFQANGLKRLDLSVSGLGSKGTSAELISQSRTGNPNLIPPNNINAQTITVVAENGAERNVTIPSGVAADYVAEQLSAELSPLGIKVSSHTRVFLEMPTGIQTGTIGFDIAGTNIVPVSVATSVSLGDLTGLAEAINYRSTVTGISATLTNDSKRIVLDHPEGADIFISNMLTGSINMDVSVLDGDFLPFEDIPFDFSQGLAFSGTTQPIAEVAAEVAIGGVNFASAAITGVESSTSIADDGYTVAFDATNDKVTVTGAPTGAGTLAVAMTDTNGHIVKANVTVAGSETRDELATKIDTAIDGAASRVAGLTQSQSAGVLTLAGGASFANIGTIAHSGNGESIALASNVITVTTPATSDGTISFDLVDADGNTLKITTANITANSSATVTIDAIEAAISAAITAASTGLTTTTTAGSDYIAANSGPIKNVVDDETNITLGTGISAHVMTMGVTNGSLAASIEGTSIAVTGTSDLNADAASFATAVNANVSLLAMGIKAVAASDSTGQVSLYYKNAKSLSQNTRITGQLSMTSKSGFDLQSSLDLSNKSTALADSILGGLVSRSFTEAGTSASLQFAANVEIDGAATNVDGTKAQAPSAFYDVKLDAVGGAFDVNISSGEIGETSSALIAAGIAEKMRSQAPVPSITGVPIASLPAVGSFARFSIGDAQYTLERNTNGLRVSGPEAGRVFINTENVYSGAMSTSGEPVLLGQSITLSVNGGSLTGHAPAPLFDDNASLFGFGVGANYSSGSDKFSLVDPKVTHKAKSILQGRDFAIPTNGTPTNFTATVKDTAINVTLTNNFNPTSVSNITVGADDTYNQLTVSSAAGSTIDFGISFMGGIVSGTYDATASSPASSDDLNARAINLADAINASSTITTAGGSAVASTNGTGLVVIEGALKVATNETITTSSPSSNIAMRQVSEISVTGATFSTAAFTSSDAGYSVSFDTSDNKITVTGAPTGAGTLALALGHGDGILKTSITISGSDTRDQLAAKIAAAMDAGATSLNTITTTENTSAGTVQLGGVTPYTAISNTTANGVTAGMTTGGLITVSGTASADGALSLGLIDFNGHELEVSVAYFNNDTTAQITTKIGAAIDAAKAAVTVGTTATNATLVSSSATVSSGNNLALVGGGTVTLSASRQITITSAGNDSDKTFTIMGTDADGNALTEVVTGANASVAASTNYFKTITSIDPSANPAGATTAGIIVDDKITLTPSSTSDATITIEGVAVTATGISDARFKFDANGLLTTTQADIATQKNNYASQFALAINENVELAALGLSAVPSVDGSGDINVSRLSVSLTPTSGPTAIQLTADLASGPIQITGGASATTLGFKVAESDLLVTEDGLRATSLNGLPVDLSGSGTSLAETRMQLTGLPTEELIVVVAGGGSRRISAKYTIDADTAVDPLKKESQYQVKMLDVNSGRVELFDKVTGHSIATRISNGTAQFDADGLRFNLNGYAATGDSFDVLTGQKSAGDSRNMDEIMDLATSTVSRSSFQDDFRSIAASVGSTLESSRLSKLSAEAVRDAAVAAEDEVSGVNMDEEAAKLITQQQAYQAAARILQTAKEMFDTLMQIR